MHYNYIFDDHFFLLFLDLNNLFKTLYNCKVEAYKFIRTKFNFAKMQQHYQVILLLNFFSSILVTSKNHPIIDLRRSLVFSLTFQFYYHRPTLFNLYYCINVDCFALLSTTSTNKLSFELFSIIFWIFLLLFFLFHCNI